MEVGILPRKIIQVEDKVPLSLWAPLSLQHMFAMFGASVLVPILFHADPAVILLMNGIATLLFILITKGKAPAYLGSSFAFLSPVFVVLGDNFSGNYPLALGAFVVVGIVGMLFALLIKFVGIRWIDVVLPPAAMGPVVALIGLELASVAVGDGNANLLITANNPAILPANLVVFLVTLGVAVVGSVCFRKFFSVIPILIAIVTGYVVSLFYGLVDFSKVAEAAWFQLPNFQFPRFEAGAILTILPAVLVVITEHIGHQLVTSKIVGRDLLKDPGLHRSLFADFFSTSLSGLVGSVPTTTYGENIGVMAITRVYSVRVIGGAAVISALIAFCGKVSTLIQLIPGPVIGGVSFLLYGMIAASGIRLMVESQIDYSKSRNLVLTAIVFITGLSGVTITLGSVSLKGMVLAAIVAILLSLLFYVFDLLKLTNDRDDATEEAVAAVDAAEEK